MEHGHTRCSSLGQNRGFASGMTGVCQVSQLPVTEKVMAWGFKGGSLTWPNCRPASLYWKWVSLWPSLLKATYSSTNWHGNHNTCLPDRPTVIASGERSRGNYCAILDNLGSGGLKEHYKDLRNWEKNAYMLCYMPKMFHAYTFTNGFVWLFDSRTFRHRSLVFMA